jgi:hypothetical protein
LKPNSRAFAEASSTQASGGFPSTHWTEVERAGLGEEEAGRVALGELLTRYQAALEGYARQRFASADREVGDWFQGFVAGPILQRGLIAKARPMEGRLFRSYLLSAWHTFILEQHRHATARKRLPPGGLQPLPDSGDDCPGATAPPAAEVFDVAWARSVLSETARRMQAQCEAEGRNDVWGVFEVRIHRPILEGAQPLEYEELIARFELVSPVQARNLLVTGKRMFARCLRQVVGQYAKGQPAIEAELSDLHAILERAP